MDDFRELAKRAVIMKAGELAAGETQVEKFVVQEWSSLNQEWMDGPSEMYDTEDEAREREVEISGWAHIDRTRIVHRTVAVAERVLGDGRHPIVDVPLATDTEVTVKLTGRVVHSTTSRLVVEYLRDNGFPDRIAIHRSAPGVTVQIAPDPSPTEIAARQDAHWRVATSTPDPEVKARALLEMPYRDRLPDDRAAVMAAEDAKRAERK